MMDIESEREAVERLIYMRNRQVIGEDEEINFWTMPEHKKMRLRIRNELRREQREEAKRLAED